MSSLTETEDERVRTSDQIKALGTVSFIAMTASVASLPLLAFAFIYNWHVGIQAFSLLLSPLAIGTWIYTAIKGLHRIQLRFWSMRSTKISYAFLAATFALLFLIPSAGLLGGESSKAMLAGAIAASIAWLAFLALILITNIRAIRILPLALAVSGLQFGALLFIWLLVFLMLAAKDTQRAQEEYDRRPY